MMDPSALAVRLATFSLLSTPHSPSPSDSAAKQVLDRARDALDKSVKGEEHLCTTLCDLLFGLPKQSTFERSEQLIADFEKCYENDAYESKKGIYYCDLRGMYADEAKKVLIGNLYDWIRPPCFVKYIVGCKVHGVGKGTLMNAVIGFLNRGNIMWDKEWGGSVISIQLGGKNLEVDRLWGISLMPPHVDVKPISPLALSMLASLEKSLKEEVPCEELGISEDCEDEEITSETKACVEREYEMRPLCIAACDTLFGLRRPSDQPYDENMIRRVMSGLEMCRKDSSKEGMRIVDLRGCFVEEAFQKLIQHLNGLSSERGDLYVRVGCEEHGNGEGKLKKALIALLRLEGTIEFDKNYSDSLVRITLDGRESYSFVGDVLEKILDEYEEGFFLPSDSDSNIDESFEREVMQVLDGPSLVNPCVDDDYTITCDLIYDFPYQSQDQKMSGRVVEDLDKLDIIDRDSSCSVNLVCRSLVEVLRSLELHLRNWSYSRRLGSKNSIIGCRVLCYGERKAVLDMLKDKTEMGLKVKVERGYVCITFDGKED